jgi:hypothetical protein
MAERRKVKARYRVIGPKVVTQTYTKAWIDEETKSLHQEQATRKVEMYEVYMPQGHSIRVGYDELVRLGFDKRPRLVDMETGDVVDIGGDPYDFAPNLSPQAESEDEIFLVADDDETEAAPKTGSKKG